MTMQSVLSTEYSKSLKEFLRFAIIGTNLMAFYYFSGFRRFQLGPELEEQKPFRPLNMPKIDLNRTTDEDEKDDPLRFFSSLDMLAFILAIYLALKQLTFGRPEIDSFREKIILLPQEKKAAIILLLFSLFKLTFQWFYPLGDEWGLKPGTIKFGEKRTFKNNLDEIRDRGYFMLKKVPDKFGMNNLYLDTRLSNLILVLSSILCLASSYIFKLEIHIAEKRMILKIVKFFSMLAQLGMASALTYIMFLGENKCVCLIFIFVLIFDALRAIKLALYSSSKKNRPDIKDYLLTLKWVTFTVLSLIISGSFFYNIVRCYVYRDDEFPKDPNLKAEHLPQILVPFKNYLTWMDYFLLFFQKQEGIESELILMPRIVIFSHIESHQERLHPSLLNRCDRVHCRP